MTELKRWLREFWWLGRILGDQPLKWWVIKIQAKYATKKKFTEQFWLADLSDYRESLWISLFSKDQLAVVLVGSPGQRIDSGRIRVSIPGPELRIQHIIIVRDSSSCHQEVTIYRPPKGTNFDTLLEGAL